MFCFSKINSIPANSQGSWLLTSCACCRRSGRGRVSLRTWTASALRLWERPTVAGEAPPRCVDTLSSVTWGPWSVKNQENGAGHWGRQTSRRKTCGQKLATGVWAFCLFWFLFFNLDDWLKMLKMLICLDKYISFGLFEQPTNITKSLPFLWRCWISASAINSTSKL